MLQLSTRKRKQDEMLIEVEILVQRKRRRVTFAPTPIKDWGRHVSSSAPLPASSLLNNANISSHCQTPFPPMTNTRPSKREGVFQCLLRSYPIVSSKRRHEDRSQVQITMLCAGLPFPCSLKAALHIPSAYVATFTQTHWESIQAIKDKIIKRPPEVKFDNVLGAFEHLKIELLSSNVKTVENAEDWY